MYRRLFTIHSWLGLLSGVLLLVISLSGVLLVFMEELDPLFYKNHYNTEGSGKRLSFDNLYATIVREQPTAQNIYFRNLDQQAPDRNVLFSYSIYNNGDEDYIGAAINPYNGQIVSRRSEREKLSENFFGWMLRFHYSLHGGAWGELFVSLLSLAFVGSLLTGIIVYRKFIIRALLFRVKLHTMNWRRLSSDLHRIVGVWALLFNLLIAVTGFWMLKYVYQASTYQKPDVQLSSLPSVPAFSIDTALEITKRHFPDFRPAFLNIPAGDTVYEFYGHTKGQWAIHANYSSTLIIHSETGRLLSNTFITEQSFAQKLDAAAGPLHFGIYGGWPVKLLYSSLGLSAPLLSITGFLLWWRKRRKPKKQVSRSKKG